MPTESLSRRQRRSRRADCPDDSEQEFLQRIARAVEQGPESVQTPRISVFTINDENPDTILTPNDRRVGFTVHNDTAESELLLRLDDKKPKQNKYFDRIPPGATREYFQEKVGRWRGTVTALWRLGQTQQDVQALFTEFIG